MEIRNTACDVYGGVHDVVLERMERIRPVSHVAYLSIVSSVFCLFLLLRPWEYARGLVVKKALKRRRIGLQNLMQRINFIVVIN